MKQIIRYAMMLLVAALFTTACNKEFVWDSFSLNNDDSDDYCVKLEKNSSGSTRVSVFSDSEWTAELENNINWGSLSNASGKGSGHFLFHYEANNKAERRAYVLVHSKGITKRVLLLQAGNAITFRFRAEDGEMVIEKNATTYYLALDSNISNDLYNQVEVGEVEYLDPQTGWISNVSYQGEQLAIDVALNDSGTERGAKIGISFTDPYTSEVYGPSFVTIKQGTESSVEITWDQLLEKYNAATDKASDGSWVINIDPNEFIGGGDTPSDEGDNNENTGNEENGGNNENTENGTQTRNGEENGTEVVNGVKISGINLNFPGNGNSAMNTQSRWSGSSFPAPSTDKNDATTYFMSKDGKYSFKIEMASGKDNIIPQYATADIRVDGVTIRREGAGRYKLSNVASRNVVSIVSGTEADVPVIERSLSELTTNDYYRIVTIKDVELVYNQGALYNTTDGYRYCCDYYPTLLRDKDGNKIYMMLSYETRYWSRNGNPAPKGSGNVTGFITYETDLRYGSNGILKDGSRTGVGSLGSFVIRPFDAGCLQFNSEAENGFSQVHTAWNWNDSKLNLNESGNATLAKVGEGKLYHELGTAPRLGNNFNGLMWNTSATDTQISSAACAFDGGAWVDASGNFKGIVLEFNATTLGSGASLNIAYWGGNQGTTGVSVPANWQIEWSLDGVTYTAIEGSQFDVHPFVWWTSTCPTFATHGLAMSTFQLPAELSGVEKAYVRIVPYTLVCSTASDSEGGTYSHTTTNGRFTLADVTIKYNK